MPTPNMMQAATQIRKWWEGAKPVVAWVRGHAAAAMAATLFLVAAVWLMEHDARIQREAELGVMRRETATEVSALRQRAEAAIQESRARERVIHDLETCRTVLEREASALRARLNSLREEDRFRVRPAIIPGHNEAAGSATSRPDPARVRPEIPESLDELRAEQAADVAESKIPNLNFQEGAASEGRPAGGTLQAADTCREQVDVQGQIIANCEERAELNRAALEAAKQSARELGEALRAKDAMAARLDEQHRAELKVARGSRLRRFGRALQYVGVGVVIGMAVAR